MKTIVVLFDTLCRRYLPNYNPCTDTIADNFKRLGEQTVQFDNSYVGSMPCIPARRELHTGRYNFLHREWGPLEPFDDSMPEMLAEHGVYTHLISDHFHYWEDGGADYHTRYSSWEIVRGQAGDHWKGVLKDPEIPAVVKVPQKQQGGGTSTLWRQDWVNREYILQDDESTFPQTKTFDLGCEFIETNHEADNWFLQIECFDPHEPFYVPNTYLEKYQDEYHGKHFDWPRGQADETMEEIDHVRREYQSLVSMCDHSLGRVLDLMDKYDMWDDTMLIVGTDHGFLLGEHEYWGKNQMPYYNEIAHTPLFIWDPRYGVKNEARQSIVQMIDWMPYILQFFGVEIPKDVQGKPLDDIIQHDTPNRDYALFGTFGGHVNITDGKYVYMRAPLVEKKDDVYNYTLMPTHMKKRFSPEELHTMELVEPFTFSKDCKVLKIKSKDKYNVTRFGTKLFDVEEDPDQLHPIENKEVEERLMKMLINAMEENDCPKEQYVRYGLKK